MTLIPSVDAFAFSSKKVKFFCTGFGRKNYYLGPNLEKAFVVCGLQGSILCRRYEEDIDHSLWGACLLILIDQMLEFIRLVFGTLGLDR